MIPDFQTLMRPVLEAAQGGERQIADVVDEIADRFELSEPERADLLPSGRQTRIANRVHWARSYLKQAGLVQSTGRGRFALTDAGQDILHSGPARIDMKFLEQFPEYLAFKSRSRNDIDQGANAADSVSDGTLVTVAESGAQTGQTPTETIDLAYREMREALAADLIDRLRSASPAFFEQVVVDLLTAMGYGGAGATGSVTGGSGDGGVDGVIDKDPLGLDQIYVQAKRYGANTPVGAGDIRDFFGALSLKDVSSGIFITTSSFTAGARQTADKLGARIVLVDGPKLTGLLIDHEIGCRVRKVYPVAELDEGFFG